MFGPTVAGSRDWASPGLSYYLNQRRSSRSPQPGAILHDGPKPQRLSHKETAKRRALANFVFAEWLRITVEEVVVMP
jgi:hypothetical protein